MAIGKQRSFRQSYHTKEAVTAQATKRYGGFDDYIKSNFKKYKVRDGKNVIRILPATWKGADHYALTIWLNYKIGPDNATYLSLGSMGKGRDPLAEALRVADRENDEELVKTLKPSPRLLAWVIDRQAPEEGPQIWSYPPTLGSNLSTLAKDEDTGAMYYVDLPDEGNDIRFYKEGKALNTKYDPLKIKILATSPLSDDPAEIDAWLKYAEDNPLPDTLNFYSYDYISQVFNGTPAKTNGKANHEPVETEDTPPPRQREGDDGAPARVARRVATDQDDLPEDPAPRRARPRVVEDDTPPFEGGSIRARIQARRQAVSSDEYSDD